MSRLLLAALLVAAAANGAHSMLWWRDKITSVWAQRPLSMDGGAEQWTKNDEADETSVVFRAMNDSTDLYLLLTPGGRDGKGLLTGAYLQDATLWFHGSDRKTRAWGLRIPYSRLDRLAPGTTQAPTVEPEFLTMQGALASTAPLPGDISLHLERDGRKPMIQIRIALKNIASTDGKPIPLDFTTTAVPPAVAEQIKNEKPAARAGQHGGQHGGGSGGGGRHGGGRHGGGRHGGAQTGSPGGQPSQAPPPAAEAPTVPDPLNLELSVKLAKALH